MKILFIQRDPLINIGLMSISAYIKQHNHDADLLIDNIEKNLFEEIAKINPDIIAFPASTGMHTWVIKKAEEIKKKFQNKPILVGGPHSTFFPDMIKEKAIDIVCIGEGEEATLEFLEKLKSKKDIFKIKNLHVKKSSKIFKNQVRHLEENLDKYPMPDRQLYSRYPFILKQKNYSTITGRGCPFNCSFCFNKSLKEIYDGKGKYVRRRSIKNVIDELIIAKKTGINSINFLDDTFIYNYAGWLKEFLKEYKEKIDLPFSCTVRPNIVTDEICEDLKWAGCHSVKMGIESGNEFLNNQVLGRNLTNKQIKDAMIRLKRAKLKVETFVIVGVPGETLETALETLRFSMEIKSDFARCSLLQPYPRTEIEAYAKKTGYLDVGFDLNAFENSYFIDTPIILKDKKEIINIHRFFNICVRFPFLYPIVKQLIKLPNNFLYDLLFKIDYAFAVFFIDKMSLKDLFFFGLYSKGFFKK